MAMEQPQTKKNSKLGHYGQGVDAPWYEGRELTDEERSVFRERSKKSHRNKMKALNGEGPEPIHPIYKPRLNLEELMPQLEPNGLRVLSLFSGGGGLDLGFDRAGFEHVASYEIMTDAAITISSNRPGWKVYGGDEGDVTKVDFTQYKGLVDVVHGGPPCQPFSSAGRQLGAEDDRNLFPEFVRAVKEIKPIAFIAENVKALTQAKFSDYVQANILGPLSESYDVTMFELSATSFGVPQIRNRVFIVGFKKGLGILYTPPEATHSSGDAPISLSLFEFDKKSCMGAREALGLPNIGFDEPAPTIRSGLTGPRHTTSIVSSTSAMKKWDCLHIWPNGVAASREKAQQFVASNGHFRLSVQDCAILQGFPESWSFNGAVYMILGQIGNSVAPPMAYNVAVSVARALTTSSRNL